MLAITYIIETLSVFLLVVMNRGAAKLQFTKLEKKKIRKVLYLFHQADSMGSRVFVSLTEALSLLISQN